MRSMMDDGRANEFLEAAEMTEGEAFDLAAKIAAAMSDLDPDRADAVLEKAADTYRERRAVYGENFRAVGRVMKALFPKGVNLETEDDHNRFHILMLEVVKLTRYAENWHRGGHEDSQLDLSVYAAMLVQIDREIAREEPELA